MNKRELQRELWRVCADHLYSLECYEDFLDIDREKIDAIISHIRRVMIRKSTGSRRTPTQPGETGRERIEMNCKHEHKKLISAEYDENGKIIANTKRHQCKDCGKKLDPEMSAAMKAEAYRLLINDTAE